MTKPMPTNLLPRFDDSRGLTPAPWSVGEDQFIVDAKGDYVAEVHCQKGNPKVLPLLAQAPSLLAERDRLKVEFEEKENQRLVQYQAANGLAAENLQLKTHNAALVEALETVLEMCSGFPNMNQNDENLPLKQARAALKLPG